MSFSTHFLIPLFLPVIWVLGPWLQVEGAHAQTASVDSNDPPDLKKEKRFFDIYSHYNQEPTSEENWSAATTGKAQEYKVQAGDTLWGVSETLFADPQFWPKIWSLNRENIENPHEIHPDQTVQFIPGTMGEAPSIAVTENGAVEEKTSSVGAKVSLSQVELPAPAKVYPRVSAIPQSIPSWGYRKDRQQEILMEVEKLNRNFAFANEALSYFITDKETQGVGKISETEMNQSSAAEFQYVFVQFSSVPAEKNFLVVKDLGQVKDSVSGKKGTMIQVQGSVEILEPVNSEKFLYRALVKRALGLVEVGAHLVPGEIPTYSMQDEGEGGTAKARIIGGQYGLKRQLFGPSNVVFLAGEGLALGQSYPIFKVQKLRNEETEGTQSPRKIGRVKIIKQEQDFFTGVVLQATEEIQVGDITNPQEK